MALFIQVVRHECHSNEMRPQNLISALDLSEEKIICFYLTTVAAAKAAATEITAITEKHRNMFINVL